MKGIELISGITEDQKKILLTSVANYKRFARLYFAVIESTDTEIVVKAFQLENEAENYLTTKEIIERTHGVFDFLGLKVHVRPIAFAKEGLETVSADYVHAKMNELGLSQKDLVKLLNISKSNISTILSENRMTRSSQAMFFYLFKYLELKK